MMTTMMMMITRWLRNWGKWSKI